MTIDPNPPIQYFGETTGTKARLPVQTLGQEDFLKLLVAQMTSQDPLNPKTDLEMIPQMVQFTTLEQSKAMQAGVAAMQTDMALLRLEQQVWQANSLIGRTVEIQDGTGTTLSGEVTAVRIEEGMPKLVINGHRYDLSSVLSVRAQPAH